MKISDTDDGFQQALRRAQIEEVGMIPEGVEFREDTSLRKQFIRGLTMEVLDNVLDSSVLETKKSGEKEKKGGEEVRG